MRKHRSTRNSHASLKSVLAAALVAAIATGAVLTVGSSPAVAEGTIGSHAVNLTQPAFRSVVVGAAVVSLATLDLPGPVSVPHRADYGPAGGDPTGTGGGSGAAGQPTGGVSARLPASASRAATTPSTPETASTAPTSSRRPPGTGWASPACPTRLPLPSRTRPRWSCRRGAVGASGRPAPGASGSDAQDDSPGP